MEIKLNQIKEEEHKTELMGTPDQYKDARLRLEALKW